MSPRNASISVVAVPSVTERIRIVKRESRRDFAGVAAGVTLGAIIWSVMLAVASVLL
jgi:hypothetical protein